MQGLLETVCGHDLIPDPLFPKPVIPRVCQSIKSSEKRHRWANMNRRRKDPWNRPGRSEGCLEFREAKGGTRAPQME